MIFIFGHNSAKHRLYILITKTESTCLFKAVDENTTEIEMTIFLNNRIQIIFCGFSKHICNEYFNELDVGR